MTWPTSSLSKTNVDADGDTITGVGGGRDQLEDAIDRLNALAAEAVALLDEAGTYTAKQTFSLLNTPVELKGLSSNGVYLPFFANVAAPTTRTGRIGYIGGASELVLENEATNGHVNLKTNGTGEVRANGIRVLTTADSTTPADGTITRAKLDTLTASLAGNVGAGDKVSVALSHSYVFFPMIHYTSSTSFGGLSGHATDANDADLPRLAFFNSTSGKGAATYSYDIDYRYVDT